MTHLNDITTDTNVSTRSKGSHLTIDDRVKISGPRIKSVQVK